MLVVTLAADLADSGRAVHVGPDKRRAGLVAGGLMGRLLPNGGAVVMVAGVLSNADQRAREEGFREVLAAHYPQCEIASVLETREDADVAARRAEAAFSRNLGLRGLYYTSAGTHSIVRPSSGLVDWRTPPL